MKQRSNKNWQTRSGVYDSLNTEYLDFDEDYPVLSSITNINSFEVVVCNNYKHIKSNSLVNTFVDDYILERFWNNPLKYVNYFKESRYVLSPDFSILIDMPKPMAQWNVFRNRFVGKIWENEGLTVIPTVSWGNEKTFDFSFEGLTNNTVVAISNIGCRNEEQKLIFDKGYKELINKVTPSAILFWCNKKYRSFYQNEEIIFIDSFWDLKRKQNKI